MTTTLSDGPTPVASPVFVTIILEHNIEGTSDFFPFHDLAHLNDKDNPFSFTDLIEDGINGGQEISLYTTGCQIGGSPDCTQACVDPALFFASLETFYNCAALASISYWTHEVQNYYVSPAAEVNASSIMGNGTLSNFDPKPVLTGFTSCAQKACLVDGLSQPCDESIRLLTNTSTASNVFDALDSFCPNIKAELNPDIFGPGVLISYVLQVCFSSLLYIFLKLFSVWVRYSYRTPKKPFTLNRIESMIWSDSSAMSRTSVALATTLVEFQEAQAWFVFALQLAAILAIVVNSQEGTFWGEIIVNAAVAYHVSQNGILPMFLVQICLHNEGIRNWHTFLGFLFEYFLAIVATTQNVKFEDAFKLFGEQKLIEECGNNPSPRTYCAALSGVDGFQLSFFPNPLLYKMVFLVLDTIAICVLLIDQISWTLRKHRLTRHKTFLGHPIGQAPAGRFRPHWLMLKAWFWRILELTYLIVNFLYLVSLIQVITVDNFKANKWSYGQIIAVTVWGPVIVKLFDLILSGPPNNGIRSNAGPPRLRIDNVINRRHGTDADEDLEVEEYRETKSRRASTVANTSSSRPRDLDILQEEAIGSNPEGEVRRRDHVSHTSYS